MDRTRSSLLLRVRDPADAAAWGEFLALYEPLVSSYIRHRGLGEEDSRDVVQDVLARLVKSLGDFELDRQRGRFRTWLWQVCQSALVDWARKKKRQARAENAWLERLSKLPPHSDDDPDAEWEHLHRRHVLAFALQKVRARSRPATWACFERHVLQKEPASDAARALGLSVNAVNVNCSRILSKIRNYCAEHLEGLADGCNTLPDGR
jgi:RNA polymerase sigma-70 factor, ECF subfamily